MGTRVACFETYSEACLAMDQVKGRDIKSVTVDRSSHVSIAGGDAVYYVEVCAEEAAEAREALVEMGYDTGWEKFSRASYFLLAPSFIVWHTP